MTTTIVQQPKLRLITAKSTQFPVGNRAAFVSIESHLKSLKGRKFYGLVFGGPSGLDYYAALLPDNEIEERRFVASGFEIMEIPAGPCARIKLLDWTSKTDQIGPLMSGMMQQHTADPTRPQMEYYRSLTELHLLLPVVA